ALAHPAEGGEASHADGDTGDGEAVAAQELRGYHDLELVGSPRDWRGPARSGRSARTTPTISPLASAGARPAARTTPTISPLASAGGRPAARTTPLVVIRRGGRSDGEPRR